VTSLSSFLITKASDEQWEEFQELNRKAVIIEMLKKALLLGNYEMIGIILAIIKDRAMEG